jgi:hypothetical protein
VVRRGAGARRGQTGEAGLHLGVGHHRQRRADRRGQLKRLQALRRVVVVFGQLILDNRLEQRVLHLPQRPALAQQFPERAVPRQHPGVHGLDQLVAGDEVVLQRHDAEQQVAVRTHGQGLHAGVLCEDILSVLGRGAGDTALLRESSAQLRVLA